MSQTLLVMLSLFPRHLLLLPLLLLFLLMGGTPRASAQITGPILGHIDSEQALIWFRPAAAGTYQLTLVERPSGKQSVHRAVADPKNDLCLVWRVRGLKAATEYTYRILEGDTPLVEGEKYRFTTAPARDAKVRISLALGSCASSTKHPEIWQRMAAENVEGVVLLGDTPYIDTADREVNRKKHREFLQLATLAELGAGVPFWGTWDDHDFGGNDTDGNKEGKEIIRKVFTEYRALDHFGENGKGIYSRFRRGPIEVFLLDARYFAQTEPSPVDANQPTCLGARQWEWLQKHLKASDAKFKILATGMIWDDKKNSEKDDWHTYRHEREALLDFVSREKINGVILVGGDIHCCRALRYKTEERIGYPLWQFIASPLHDRVIKSLNVPHPDLVFGRPVKNVFLKLTADSTQKPATLEAVFIQQSGERLFKVKLDADELSVGRPAPE